MYKYLTHCSKTVGIGLFFLLFVPSCAASKPDEIKINPPNEPTVRTERGDDGTIVQQFTAHGNDNPDIIKYFEDQPDPETPTITRRVLKKMELDANGDGQINIRRYYNDDGLLEKEELDLNFDTKINVINYFDYGRLTRKDILSEQNQTVLATHYYAEDILLRIEKDTDNNGSIDYWEIYEEGVLDRIGRDLSGDGKVDSWRRRQTP